MCQASTRTLTGGGISRKAVVWLESAMARPNLGKLVASHASRASQTTKLVTKSPARTRFAPSPTGFVHLGSLRTALFNYLLARATKGQFLLRLEDTDRARLIPGAESNIYNSLKRLGVHWDEGPFRQSERQNVYAEHATKLLDSGHAYRCFCSKERLDSLASSARQLIPPSTASYDRKCAHLSEAESAQRAENGAPFVLRFKSPETWPVFEDLLHGAVNVQTQTNPMDRRFDDFVLVKSDGMPTYHFANVVDDTLMRITHVIRGEEWLPSTPKHVALYNAFKQTPPKFVHIPLLVGEGGKKLSKRKSDQGVLDFLGPPGYVGAEALVNFVALLGWSPTHKAHHRIGESVSDVMDMKELEKQFGLEGLTTGNIQVDFSKLKYLDHEHFKTLVKSDFDDASRRCHEAYPALSLDATKAALNATAQHVGSVADYVERMDVLFAEPEYARAPSNAEQILELLASASAHINSTTKWDPSAIMKHLMAAAPKRQVYESLRYALLAGKSGISVLEAMTILGRAEAKRRIDLAADQLRP